MYASYDFILALRNAYVWVKSLTRSKHALIPWFSTSTVLKCLQAFSDSAFQILLQVTVLLITWDRTGEWHTLLT